jgi:hypothetical protein
VWEGSDGDLLEAMFRFYATIPPEPILDATYNAGRFWKGSRRRVVSMDIDPKYKPAIVGDNREMKGVKSVQFGVVVYDPPHVGPQGRDKSKKRFDVDFGATVGQGARLEPELPVSAVPKTGQTSPETGRPIACEDHGYGEQPQVEMAALRLHGGWQKTRGSRCAI